MGMLGFRRRPPAWLFGLVGAVVVAGFAFATYRVWSNDNALRDRGQRASAQVVDTRKRDEVEFRTSDGRLVHALIGQRISAPKVEVGDRIEVVYDPADPSSDVDDARALGDGGFAYVTLGFTVATAVAVPVLTWRLSRRRRPSGDAAADRLDQRVH